MKYSVDQRDEDSGVLTAVCVHLLPFPVEAVVPFLVRHVKETRILSGNSRPTLRPRPFIMRNCMYIYIYTYRYTGEGVPGTLLCNSSCYGFL